MGESTDITTPLKQSLGGWRDGLVVKSTGYAPREPGFCSHHPHGSSQSSATPVPIIQHPLLASEGTGHASGI